MRSCSLPSLTGGRSQGAPASALPQAGWRARLPPPPPLQACGNGRRGLRPQLQPPLNGAPAEALPPPPRPRACAPAGACAPAAPPPAPPRRSGAIPPRLRALPRPGPARPARPLPPRPAAPPARPPPFLPAHPPAVGQRPCFGRVSNGSGPRSTRPGGLPRGAGEGAARRRAGPGRAPRRSSPGAPPRGRPSGLGEAGKAPALARSRGRRGRGAPRAAPSLLAPAKAPRRALGFWQGAGAWPKAPALGSSAVEGGVNARHSAACSGKGSKAASWLRFPFLLHALVKQPRSAGASAVRCPGKLVRR